MSTAKTTVQLIFDAFDNSGRSGFAEWMRENRDKLLLSEREEIKQAYERGIKNYGVPPLQPQNEYEMNMHQHWGENEEDNHSGTIKHFQD